MLLRYNFGGNRPSQTDPLTLSPSQIHGIANFLGLRAIFEQMTPQQIDDAVDLAIMPILEKGMFR